MDINNKNKAEPKVCKNKVNANKSLKLLNMSYKATSPHLIKHQHNVTLKQTDFNSLIFFPKTKS